MSKKIALVTGGIGTQICRRLADAGWRLVANHLPSEVEGTERWLEQQKADDVAAAVAFLVGPDVEGLDRVSRGGYAALQ